MGNDNDNIVNFANHASDARSVTPVQCLEMAANDLRKGEVKATKVMVLCLDDSNYGYSTCFYNAGMSRSQMVALCSHMQFILNAAMIDG